VNPTNKSPALHKIPIYEVRLVQARRALRLAEPCIGNSQVAARALHGLIGLTDREHFACLFVDGHHNVTGAHIAAIGGQHCIAAVDVRVILRTALAACATAMIVGHYVPRNIMTVLFPPRLCSRITAEQHSRRSESSRIAT
jgi:DNA repair protein RadC